MPTAKSDVVRLHHILDAVTKALKFTATKSRKDLDTDEQMALALVRLIEIMGEAASRMTIETQNTHPGIPWRRIIGTRNRLIHGYDRVDLDILWQIVNADLPPLAIELQKIVNDKESQGKLL